jgi:hypothetical protein
MERFYATSKLQGTRERAVAHNPSSFCEKQRGMKEDRRN